MNCGNNAVSIGSICQCKSGYGIGKNGECVECEYVLDGFCVTCPGDREWMNNRCVCPPGREEIGGICKAKCLDNELVDAQGNCYTCPITEIAVNGRCECVSGSRNPATKRCEVKCLGNSFLVGDKCATCPLNLVRNAKLGVCVCPDGFRKSSNYVCEPYTVPPIECDAGKYYDKDEGCLSCHFDCKTCKDSANYCMTCSNPSLVPQNGKCVLPCGNGQVGVNEQCDDGNGNNKDGCSSTCIIEPGYTCTGSPSVCKMMPSANCGNGVINNGETCDDNNKNPGDGCSATCQTESGYDCTGQPSICKSQPQGMKLHSEPIFNSGAVYLTIITDKQYIFNNREEMSKFMQFSFPNPETNPVLAFCNQQAANPKLFTCYFTYPSGFPMVEYTIHLFFNYKGDIGSLDVAIDYRKSAFSTRSLA